MNTVTSEAVSIDEHTHRQFWLGVDGGGTNSRAAVVDQNGTVLGEGRSAAANLLRVGLDNAVNHIRQAVNDACREAGIEVRKSPPRASDWPEFRNPITTARCWMR
jgi:Ethanolamine utilization protein EutJ (predicted chaperonin)